MNGVSVSSSNPNPVIVVDAKGSTSALSLSDSSSNSTTQVPKATSDRQRRTKKRRYPSTEEATSKMDQHTFGHRHLDDDGDHHSRDGSPKNKRRKRTRSAHRMPWEERLQQLRDYKAKHGDLLIPIRFKENPSLGKFVHNTREQYKLFQKRNPGNGKAKRCSLTAERVRQLEELGFVWSTERTKHQKEDWEARLQQLKDYKAKHGDCLVPHGYAEDPSFAEWVHRQRTTHAHMLKGDDSHNHQHSHLVEERMRQLEELGFHFTVHADKWKEHFLELKRYKEIHGHCQVPTHCPANPKLGRWVHTQRHQRRLQLKGKKSCMTDERVQLLDSLGFSWEVRPHHRPEEELEGMAHGGPIPNTNQRQHNGLVQGEANVFDDFFGSVPGDDLHLEGHSVSENSSTRGSPASQAPGHDCTFQNHHDGTQVDLFGHSLTMV